MDRIRHIGIIGEGKMGTSLFLYLLGFDFRLTWICSSEEGMEKALKAIGKKLRSHRAGGALTDTEYDKKVVMTRVFCHLQDIGDPELVIEAIPEDPEAKKRLFVQLDEILPPGSILASNSSSILPSALVPSASRKSRVAGLHFFFPVNLKKTVERVAGPGTSKETLQTLHSFLISIDKKPLNQNENNAFILNRTLLDLQAGAYQILQEGRLSMKEIDGLVREKLFPIGIFDFFDHVGIDVMLSSIKRYSPLEKDPGFYAPLIRRMEELVSQGRLGLKTRMGFYDHCQPVTPDHRQIDPPVRLDAEKRLRNYFLASVQSVLDRGDIGKEELSEALADYLGTDLEF